MNSSAIPDQPFTLSLWHRKQAAMLYHFASLDHLKGLHRMVNQLIDGVVDPLLDLAGPRFCPGRSALGHPQHLGKLVQQCMAIFKRLPSIAGQGYRRAGL
jgi:hypothetical protein